MTFTVQWTAATGVVSIARTTALGAYREAERVTQMGMRNVRIRLPGGDLIRLEDFQYPFEQMQIAPDRG
ncbi:hypothetical protein E8E01_15135 [Methylorubrum populi]|uniref:hypothetical protein n=1 Tax=Methylorubrum populi TaxID=223967 RepID=UPI0011509EA5|nr:hypothetical protein [Methylorubrum populi]QDI81681.1 hypothetical protein E8E01_15135 [Methylorubrum populi]